MIEVRQCPRCWALVYSVNEMGLQWTADPEPLDAQTAVQALLGGSQLYRVRYSRGRPAAFDPAAPYLGGLNGPDRPVIVKAHGCKAVAAPLKPVQQGGGPGGQGAHPKAPTAPSRPFSGPTRGRSTASTADRTRSRPTCSACGRPCTDGTYASIEVGELLVWAEHLEGCG